MKIGYFVPSLKKKGPINQLINLIGNLPSKSEILVLVLKDIPSDSMKSELLASHKNLNIINLDSSLLSELLSRNQRVKNLVKQYSIDIVHTQGIHSDFLLALFPTLVPTVVSLRNDPFYDYPSKFGRTKGWIMAKLHVWSVKRLKNIVACSNNISHIWRSYINFNPLVIQNGVDLIKFNKGYKKQKVNLFNKLSEDAIVFITSGSLISRKNVEILVHAFNELKSEGYYLIILGSGPEEPKLRLLSGENICFMGHVGAVESYYSMADCYISSSLSEGLPNSVLEAMSIGLPVLLSNIQSHKELFEELDYRYFFDPLNKVQLLELLRSMKREDLMFLSELCSNQISQKFTAKKNSRDYLSLYTQVLDK